MYLEEVIIVNYRSCKLVEVDLNEHIPNVYVGLNDCGKSTILLAVDLLLGNKPTYNLNAEGSNKRDLSNSTIINDDLQALLKKKNLPEFNYNGNETIVFGKLKFVDEEAEQFNDIGLSNYLLWALENTENNSIWIAQRYNSPNGEMFILSKDFPDQAKLWEYTAANLKKYLKENNITSEEIDNENGKGRFTNLEQFRAAYAKGEIVKCWTTYKLSPKDKTIFPEFKYFDWNCSFEDINSIANSIMKDEIENHLNPLKVEANRAAVQAEIAINKKFSDLSETINSVAKNVENISSKVFFNVKEQISDIMVRKKNSDGMIHLENQGEGLKRQIWFSMIKSKAESSEESNIKNYIWAFDEPETHLYPSAQRDFFDILRSISKDNVQTLISTHSTVFVDKSKIKTINSVYQEDDGYTVINYCKDVDTIYESLGVKNSDFLFYDKFLVVEGETEKFLIPKMYELYTKKTLIEDNIQLINIQGKDNWTFYKKLIQNIMTGFKKPEDQVVYLFDNDMSFKIGDEAKKNNMFFVGKQDIEDSIDNNIWLNTLNDYFKEIIDFTIEEIEGLKAKVAVNKEGGKNEKFYNILEKEIRKKLVANELDPNEIKKIPSKGSDSADFIMTSINTVDHIPEKIRSAFDKLKV